MKRRLFILVLLVLPFVTAAQKKVDEKTKAQVLSEGFKLYKSELASWYGTDIFLQEHTDLKDKAGGYFSYATPDSVKCVFFSKGDAPKILISFTFNKEIDAQSVKVDTRERKFTNQESDLHRLRTTTLAEITSDTLFKWYDNTNFNIVPLVEGKNRRAYVLTGPTVNGVVVLGNDYILEFDANNNLRSKKRLHQNIIPINYAAETDGEITTMHTHISSTGDYMTPTDVCTLLLYGKSANWKQHYTLSENFVSVWEVDREELLMLTKKAWDKIAKHSERMNKN